MLNLSPFLRFCSRVGSAQRRCYCHPSLAQRVNQHLDCLSRRWIIYSHSPISLIGATSKSVDTLKVMKVANLVKNSSSTTGSLDTCNRMDESSKLTTSLPGNDIYFPVIHENSSHRDGAIYKNSLLQDYWYDYDIDITDRNETCLEPMMLSKAAETCKYYEGRCTYHFPRHMLQFFSMTLSQSPISNSSIQLYGYIAVRDERDGLLNYVLNYSREDPIMVQQGSHIEMTGPKRGISMSCPVLIEFDMRINKGGQEEDDIQLIDGAMAFNDQRQWKPVKHRITGKCGAVDVSFAYIEYAVEATIEVIVSEVQRDFSLFLSSIVYVMEDSEEISLFHGTIDQSCGLRKFVLAVRLDTEMVLKFKVGKENVECYRSFKAMQHGCAIEQIKFEFGSVSVKVSWSTF